MALLLCQSWQQQLLVGKGNALRWSRVIWFVASKWCMWRLFGARVCVCVCVCVCGWVCGWVACGVVGLDGWQHRILWAHWQFHLSSMVLVAERDFKTCRENFNFKFQIIFCVFLFFLVLEICGPEYKMSMKNECQERVFVPECQATVRKPKG